MRLIMAVSADGYVSRKGDDAMKWTGRDDKTAFKLMTSAGDGVLGAGTTTFRAMPPTLPGRRLVQITRHANSSCSDPSRMTLGTFYARHRPGRREGGALA
jgi:dihydrofolate reductase